MKEFFIFTLFPQIIENYCLYNAPIQRALKNKIISINSINFRDFSKNKHKKVDDIPFGGGPGMVLQLQPIIDAVRFYQKPHTKIFFLDPKGKVFDQKKAKAISELEHIFLICGRYEGFDARIYEILGGECISLGNFILTSGEIAALAVLDASIRLIPGTIESTESLKEESFTNHFIEYDHFTRPACFEGKKVPDVLLSGNHKKIQEWRIKNSIKNTIKNRPDLLKLLNLNVIELKLIKEILKEIYYESEHGRNYP